MKRAVILAASIGLAVAACGGDGDDDTTVQAWCDTVERMVEVMDEVSTGDDPKTLEEVEARLDSLEGVRTDLVDGAPESIASEVETIFETDSDTINLDEQEALDEARTEVNGYIRDECRLDVGL